MWVLLKGLPGWGTQGSSNGSNGTQFHDGDTITNPDKNTIAAFFDQYVVPEPEVTS